MARSPLWQRVEHDGKTFWFGAADNAFSRMTGLVSGSDEGELVACLQEYFVEAVRDWEWAGVEFTPENVRDVPSDLKAAVITAMLTARQAESGNSSASGLPLTVSMQHP